MNRQASDSVQWRSAASYMTTLYLCIYIQTRLLYYHRLCACRAHQTHLNIFVCANKVLGTVTTVLDKALLTNSTMTDISTSKWRPRPSY